MRAMGNPEANITEPRTYYYGVDILRFSAALLKWYGLSRS